MAVRICTVAFTDAEGLRHSVNVQAETLYEAVVLAVRAFREHDCEPGSGSQLEVEAKSPSVNTLGEHAEGQGVVERRSEEPQ